MKKGLCIGIAILLLSTACALAHEGHVGGGFGQFHGGGFHGGFNQFHGGGGQFHGGGRFYGGGGFRNPGFIGVAPGFRGYGYRQRVYPNVTPYYASPEVCLDGVCCPAADFYAGICTPD
jgi:hypothetical protein